MCVIAVHFILLYKIKKKKKGQVSVDYETAKKRLSDLRMELERKLAACLLNIARLIRGAVAETIPLEETEECVPEAKYHTEEQDNGEESQHRLGDVGDDDLPLDDILSLPIEKMLAMM